MLSNVIAVLLIVTYTNAFIVPQEVPSLLSLVYSNVPPIKKGTDSRVGLGFRLGEHADFQVMFELGPQTNTKPIGNAAATTNKRNVNQDDFDDTPINYDYNRKPQKEQDGSSWLTNWSKNVAKRPILDDNPKIIMKPLISDGALRQLQALYGNKDTANPNENIEIIETIGTLPAAQLDDTNETKKYHNFQIAIPEDKDSYFDKIKKKKITADLMDINLD